MKSRCPLCRSKDQRIVYPASNNLTLSIKDFAVTKTSVKKLEVVGCNTCSLLYSSPIKQAVSNYEDVIDEDYENDKETRKKEFHTAFQKIRPFLANSDEKIKVLDIGCLTGIFLEKIKELNEKFDCYGLEPSRWAVKVCKQKGLKVKR